MLDTRSIDGIFRRKRKCNTCQEVFYTKEAFLYKAEDNPNKPKPKPKEQRDTFTKREVAAVHKKKVETRRKLEDLKQKKRTSVPSYFIEEEDW